MKKRTAIVSLLTLAMVLVTLGTVTYAKDVKKDKVKTIPNGVFVGETEISGMTEEEAVSAIQAYVSGLDEKTLLFKIDENEVEGSVSELGLEWANKEVVEEALNLGKKGNIVQKYKDLKDLENEPKIYELELEADEKKIETFITENCLEFDIEAVDSGLTRQNGSFSIVEGNDGLEVNVEKSTSLVSEFITGEWDQEDASIDLVVEVTKPKGSPEELGRVKDLLGSFTTSYSTSGTSRSENVKNGTRLINEKVLYPGDVFSVYEEVTPFTAANGYYMAGSYLNGQVVDSIGGGICQVSTTLYNTVLRAELEIVERSPHSMTVSYVDLAADAVIAGTYKDFKFRNNTDAPIYIEGYNDGKKVTFNIYGEETRPASRTIEFKSETISTTAPPVDSVTWDSSLPAGVTKVTQSAHTGYVAKLYKYVYENGVQVSVEEVNKSTYKATPKFISIGTATISPEAGQIIAEAMATGDYGIIAAAVNHAAAIDAPNRAQPDGAAAEQAAAQAAAEQAAAQEAADAAAAQAAADAAAAQAAAEAAAAQEAAEQQTPPQTETITP